jgi:hypothetical protein
MLDIGASFILTHTMLISQNAGSDLFTDMVVLDILEMPVFQLQKAQKMEINSILCCQFVMSDV